MSGNELPVHLRVFLASPGDVGDERALARNLLSELPYDPFLRGRLTLEVVAWDQPGSETPMMATMTPQEAINRGLPKPSHCDVVIVVFWSRMGTPLPYPRYKKPDGSKYFSGTEWEYWDAYRASQLVGRPDVLVYRRTERLPLFPDEHDFDAKHEQWKQVAAFFESFAGSDGSIEHGYNEYSEPEEFRKKLDSHLRSLVKAYLSSPQPPQKPRPEPFDLPLWAGSPFPGLRAFTTADAPIFFGRGRETDAVLRKLERSRFVVVVGASGSGKSSLVGAGLLPRLRSNAIPGSKDWILPWYEDNKRWSGVRLTPGEVSDDPFVALAVKLGPLVGEVPRVLVETLRREPQQVGRYVDRALSSKREWSQLVILIDQFEELFTVAAPRYEVAFIHLLSVLAEHERCRTIATIRSDFYHRCIEDPTLSELLGAGSFPLSTPSDTFNEMITKPAERAGLVLEEGLVGRILIDMAGQPGSLPLMAYTLDELYKAAAEDGVICLEDYEDLGGVRGAIGRRAEEMYKDLGGDAREALPKVFRNLIAVDEAGNATRRRAPLADFADDAAALDFIEVMTKARLLTATERGEAVLHVAHEALFNAWERLSDWIRREQDDLILLRQVRLAAALWAHKGKNDSYLWSGERLKEARAMRKRRAPILTNGESEFLRSEVDRLMDLISDPKASHRHRAEVGDRLALVGDTRPGVGLRSDGLPDLIWCKIQGLEDISISKYPITFAQYRAFAEAHDSEKFRWEPNRPTANCPAEGMSFYEGQAFCRWLGSKLGYEIRLPSEKEWKLAACGNQTEYEYPWGAVWEPLNANTAESRIVRTTAVGMYPDGASPCGVLDMSGNVWEWTLPIAETETIFLRGGSWLSNPELARISSKRRQDPNSRGNLIGFRPVALI